jgi:hypothetical protein
VLECGKALALPSSVPGALPAPLATDPQVAQILDRPVQRLSASDAQAAAQSLTPTQTQAVRTVRAAIAKGSVAKRKAAKARAKAKAKKRHAKRRHAKRHR